MALGSAYQGSGKTCFSLWAPCQKQVAVHVVFPEEKRIKMNPADQEGYWHLEAEEIYPGYHYYYQLDSHQEFPDPASHFQPQGVHGPSQVIDHSFSWNDGNWQGIDLPEMVIYELHVGTFTPRGNFQAIITRLDELFNLGINTLEPYRSINGPMVGATSASTTLAIVWTAARALRVQPNSLWRGLMNNPSMDEWCSA